MTSPAGMWALTNPLVLASASSTRRALLEAVGLYVTCVASNVDERSIERLNSDADPSSLSRVLSEAKTLAVSARHPDNVVVGADQVLSLAGRVIHKPRDIDDALDQFMALSGQTHDLYSAVAVALNGVVIDSFVERASLTMRSLDRSIFTRYVTQAGLDCVVSSVGGYQIEGLGIHLFDSIDGDHSTILGLPLLPLLDRLRRRGCLLF